MNSQENKTDPTWLKYLDVQLGFIQSSVIWVFERSKYKLRIFNNRSSLAFITLALAFVMMSCNPTATSVKNSNQDVLQAEEDLRKANVAYEAEVAIFKKETRKKIEANKLSIAEFKARIANQKKEAKEDYLKQVAALEDKNTDLQKRMDDYKSDIKENWQSFKAQFSKDMNDLGEAMKNLVENK